MRKLAFIPLGALLGVLMFSLPAAGAGATQTHDGTQTLTGYTNPCTGVTGTVTETYHLVLLDSVNPGSFHQTETWNGTLTFTPDPTLFPNALSFTGTFHNSDVVNSPYNAGYTETSLLTVNGHFSDGSHGTLHELFHVTYNANGTLTVFISGLNCSSG
jgi:hypothetical protein